MIDINFVSHHYGVRPVLRGVTFRVRQGELAALMGPNGMGKTTLMAVLAGVMTPTKGHVAIDGQRRRESQEIELAIRRKVVYLPAEPFLPLGATGREWLLAVGRLYGVRDDDRLFDHCERLLELFDLTSNADSAIAAYSTGQKKKIALCGALIAEAPVMLLDEPFSGGLDPSGILALKRVLDHRARVEGATIVMATPVPELVEELADRVAVLRDGELIAYDTVAGLRGLAGVQGSLDDVYERLVNPKTHANIERYFSARSAQAPRGEGGVS